MRRNWLLPVLDSTVELTVAIKLSLNKNWAAIETTAAQKN